MISGDDNGKNRSVSFDAKDRRTVYNEVVSDVQKAFPDYELQVAMDTDFSEE